MALLLLLMAPRAAEAQCGGITPSGSCTGGSIGASLATYTSIQQAICYQPTSSGSTCTLYLTDPGGYVEDVVVDDGRDVKLVVQVAAGGGNWSLNWLSDSGGGTMIDVQSGSRLSLVGGAALDKGDGGGDPKALHVVGHGYNTKDQLVSVGSGASFSAEYTVFTGGYGRIVDVNNGAFTAFRSVFLGDASFAAPDAYLFSDGTSSSITLDQCEVRSDFTTSGTGQWPYFRSNASLPLATSGSPDALIWATEGSLTVTGSQDRRFGAVPSCPFALARNAPHIVGGEVVAILADSVVATITDNDIRNTTGASDRAIHLKNASGTVARNHIINRLASQEFLAGIRVSDGASGSETILIENNYIANATRGIELDVYTDDVVTIQHNTIDDPSLAGFWFVDDVAITVEANAVTDASIFGAYWDTAPNPSSPNMTFASNGFTVVGTGDELAPSDADAAYSSVNDYYGVTASGLVDDACSQQAVDTLSGTSVFEDPTTTSTSPPSLDMYGGSRPVPALSNQDQGSLEAP